VGYEVAEMQWVDVMLKQKNETLGISGTVASLAKEGGRYDGGDKAGRGG
jgi:hypothetical protein